MPPKRAKPGDGMADFAPAVPHFLGHRTRLRQRLIAGGPDALPDYELLELLLFAGNPRGDTKPLAKDLIDRFGSLAEALSADADELLTVPGLGEAGGRGAEIGARGGAAPVARGIADPAGARLVGQADRLLHGDDRLRQGRGVPPPVSRPQEHADRA
jgi:hypothetical protein